MSARVWERGLLRDVYSWNFVTEPQLGKPVGNMSLEQWIQGNKQRGHLARLCDNTALWKVDEVQIPLVRHDLAEAGIIFDWKKHLTAKDE